MGTRAEHIVGVKKDLNQPYKPIYSDFTASFAPHPDTKDLARTTNVNAVKKSLRNLILTNKYERPFRPDYGCGLMHLLFEPLTGSTLSVIKNTILEAVGKYEPRVSISEVLVQGQENSVSITIAFFVMNVSEQQSMSISVDRAR